MITISVVVLVENNILFLILKILFPPVRSYIPINKRGLFIGMWSIMLVAFTFWWRKPVFTHTWGKWYWFGNLKYIKLWIGRFALQFRMMVSKYIFTPPKIREYALKHVFVGGTRVFGILKLYYFYQDDHYFCGCSCRK